MWSLYAPKLTPEQLNWHALRLPNYTMINYASLREQREKIDENNL